MDVSRVRLQCEIHVQLLIDIISDHVCPRKGIGHQLPPKCVCGRLFSTQELSDQHAKNWTSNGTCKRYSSQELLKMNSESNRHGVSIERKAHIEMRRPQIKKALIRGAPPRIFDENTMELLEKRVFSNVVLYINDSDTSEKTARSELWTWYIIFNELHPDEEEPLNPSKQLLSDIKSLHLK